jgi:hypothetical protein
VRTVLIDAALPLSFWVLVVNYITWTRHQNPTRALPKAQAPFKARYKRVPEGAVLHCFGCRVVVFFNAPKKHKLAPCGQLGIFISYAPTQKAYLVWVPKHQQVISLIHVCFDKDTNISSGISSEGEITYNDLVVSDSNDVSPSSSLDPSQDDDASEPHAVNQKVRGLRFI